MISTSYGDSFSKIYRVPKTELSSTQAPTPDKIFTLPAGGEDLSFDKDKNLYSQSESGSKYFQKRSSPWNTFYPFIYKISYETLFGDVVSVDDDQSSELPSKFNLFNNYPNPFNPSTTIKYSIPVESRRGVAPHVMLKVYNILGSEVATLVNKKQKAGNYEVDFNANSLPSGVYFYKLQIYQTGLGRSFVESKKMILLK